MFRLSIASFVVLNAAIGYAVGHPGDSAVEPLWLFTLALSLHFLVNDHSMVEHHGQRYQQYGRWSLVAGLVAGWILGVTEKVDVPDVFLAAALSYVAGGAIMNIIRHELPATTRTPDVLAFMLGATSYTVLLLVLGSAS